MNQIKTTHNRLDHKKLTFPGMKQQRPASIYLVKVMARIERRVSMAVRISQCRAKG
jgi:hypothetical protein